LTIDLKTVDATETEQR